MDKYFEEFAELERDGRGDSDGGNDRGDGRGMPHGVGSAATGASGEHVVPVLREADQSEDKWQDDQFIGREDGVGGDRGRDRHVPWELDHQLAVAEGEAGLSDGRGLGLGFADRGGGRSGGAGRGNASGARLGLDRGGAAG